MAIVVLEIFFPRWLVSWLGFYSRWLGKGLFIVLYVINNIINVIIPSFTYLSSVLTSFSSLFSIVLGGLYLIFFLLLFIIRYFDENEQILETALLRLIFGIVVIIIGCLWIISSLFFLSYSYSFFLSFLSFLILIPFPFLCHHCTGPLEIWQWCSHSKLFCIIIKIILLFINIISNKYSMCMNNSFFFFLLWIHFGCWSLFFFF